MELSWYEKQAVFIQKIKLTAPTFSITGNVRAMACNDQSCLPPTTEEFTFTGKGTPAEATKPESLQKENIKSQVSAMQKENEQLKVSIENSLNLNSIEKAAEEKLGMRKLDNNQKVYVDLQKKIIDLDFVPVELL